MKITFSTYIGAMCIFSDNPVVKKPCHTKGEMYWRISVGTLDAIVKEAKVVRKINIDYRIKHNIKIIIKIWACRSTSKVDD